MDKEIEEYNLDWFDEIEEDGKKYYQYYGRIVETLTIKTHSQP
jgi:hypothetical protein